MADSSKGGVLARIFPKENKGKQGMGAGDLFGDLMLEPRKYEKVPGKLKRIQVKPMQGWVLKLFLTVGN